MPYSTFKTLDALREQFGVTITSKDALFADVPGISPGTHLAETLAENISLALNVNTEKARSEFIIAPVLLEARRLLHREISLFSGVDFTVDDSQNLSGFCDFIVSASSDQILVEVPVVCVVEAKNENIKSGYPQCIAEMIAAQRLNDQQAHPIARILGVVTTGSNWKFLTLAGTTVLIDYDEYLISHIDRILGIFIAVLRQCLPEKTASSRL